MKIVKAFFHVFKKSLTSLDYYKDLNTVKVRFSFKYLFILAGLASLLNSTRLSIIYAPKSIAYLKTLQKELTEIFPQDLVITGKEGGWSINKGEPLIIFTPASLNQESFQLPKALIVFDHGGTINGMQKTDALIMVNSANLLFKDNKNNIQVYPLNNVPQGEYTRADFEKSMNNFGKNIYLVPVIMFLFTFIGFLVYYFVFKAAYLIMAAIVLWVAGMARRLNYNFAFYYKVALHSITLPLIIDVFISLIGKDPYLPFWFFSVNVIFGLLVINRLAKKNTVTDSQN